MFKMLKIGMLASVAVLTLFAVMAPVDARAGDEPVKAVSEDGILVFQSDDGQFKYWWDARVYLDAAGYIEDKNSLPSGSYVRRARFAIKTVLWKDWYAEVDMDFAEESAELKDLYISYRGFFGGTSQIRVGNFRQPFGLEENFTSRTLLFMERSQGTDGFAVGRRMGLEVAKWGDRYRVAASVFGNDVDEFQKDEEDETFNFAARVNYAPIRTDDSVLLVGASGALRKTLWDFGDVRFKTKFESNVADLKYVDTGVISDVDKYNLFGGELAYANKRFYTQAEYTKTNLTRLNNLQDLSFGGGYVYGAFFLTDDTHPYDAKSAEFGRVKPSSSSGAWEVAARFSTVDMDDHDITGGSSESISLGLNYYANANIRIYLNYGMVNNNDTADAKGSMTGNDDFSYVQMRFLAAF